MHTRLSFLMPHALPPWRDSTNVVRLRSCEQPLPQFLMHSDQDENAD